MALQRAQLPPVPSTLLIPLAARAHGGRYFPWLDCHDAVAPALLARLELLRCAAQVGRLHFH